MLKVKEVEKKIFHTAVCHESKASEGYVPT